MAIFGSATKNNLPTAFDFAYDGGTTFWGPKLHTIGDMTNQADPVDNKLRISDMRVSFIDTDNTLWGSLGNGTGAFGKTIGGTVYVGGLIGPSTDDLGARYEKLSLTGAYTHAFFSGKVETVKKKDNIVSISAKNLMNLLPLVEWQLPVNDFNTFEQGSYYGKYSFCKDDEIGGAVWGSVVSHAGFNKENNDQSLDFYGYPSDADGISSAYSIGVTGIYDTDAGTGIEDTLFAPDHFLNDQFYRDFKPVKFKGTFFGTKRGTITEENVAKEYGYNGLAESEADVDTDSEGTFYIIDKMRFQWPSGTADTTRPNINYRAMYRMAGDPTAILRHLLFGRMVTSYFNETDNMGTNTFYDAAVVTAFKFYNQTIDPKDTQVLPYINDLLKTESALFYASRANQFNFEPYGPKDLSVALDDIGTVEITESAYTNDLKDAYNRVSVNYGYDFETGEFAKNTYGTLAGWAVQDDVPLELDSHWLKQGNQASLTVKRQLRRYEKTFPKVSFTTSLKYSEMEIGTLVRVSDSDSGLGSKIVQLTDYRKSFGNSNQLSFSGYDGEALFSQKGYAVWEGDDLLNAAVSGTSASGWGTTIGGVGTTLGIDETLYGTQFVWW